MKLQMLTTRMLQEQKRDKEDIAQKQKENNDAINTVIANKQQLEDDAQALTTKEAELKVAQLNLAAEKSTAENEKNALLQQKAEAEKAAAAAAAAEAAYRAKQQEQQAAVKASANTTLQAQVQAAAQTPATPAFNQRSTNSVPAQTQATAQWQLFLVKHIVHLHHLIQLVNVHGQLRHWLHGLAITGVMVVNGQQVQQQLVSVLDLNHKLVRLHVGMMVVMDT